MFNIYSNVKRLCQEKGISVNFLEKKVGVSCGAISHWNESMPSGDKLVAVAGYLGTTPQDLLEEKEV